MIEEAYDKSQKAGGFMSLKEMTLGSMILTDKVAVISGGASGIGLGTAELLAEMGASVVMLDIQKEKGQQEAERLRSLGNEAYFMHCDVTSAESCKQVAGELESKFGRLDILFNNAGVAVRKDTVELLEHEWDLAMNVTLKGVYMLSHNLIPLMRTTGGGSIINTGSGWSLKGGDNAISYCAAKGGVWNMTRAMAIDHGRDKIRVNCVCPGDIDTPMLRSECAQLGENEDAFMEEAADRPIQRVGQPIDVANAVLFLASDLSKWITGTHIVVDGGGIA